MKREQICKTAINNIEQSSDMSAVYVDMIKQLKKMIKKGSKKWNIDDDILYIDVYNNWCE